MLIGRRQLEFTKEDIRHLFIEVLSGVNQRLRRLAAPVVDRAHDGGNFHEIGSVADYREDIHSIESNFRCCIHRLPEIAAGSLSKAKSA